mgnify:FL=1
MLITSHNMTLVWTPKQGFMKGKEDTQERNVATNLVVGLIILMYEKCRGESINPFTSSSSLFTF